MAEVRGGGSAEIAAPVDKVFAYRLDFTNLPDYNPHVSNLRRMDDGADPGPGAEYVFDLLLPGFEQTIQAPIRVLETDPPHRILFETGSVAGEEPSYFAREVCTFEEIAGGTRATFEITLTMPGDLDEATRGQLEATNREQAALELDLIKKALES